MQLKKLPQIKTLLLLHLAYQLDQALIQMQTLMLLACLQMLLEQAEENEPMGVTLD